MFAQNLDTPQKVGKKKKKKVQGYLHETQREKEIKENLVETWD